MGRKKRGLGEGIKEIKEHGKEATDIGSEMIEQAERVKRLLDSIEVQDEDDIQGVSETDNNYHIEYDTSFDEQVETKGQEVETKGEQISSESETELGQVRKGIGKMEQASEVSEIGHEIGERGKSGLEGSAEEYQEIINESDDVVDTTEQDIADLESRLDELFG